MAPKQSTAPNLINYISCMMSGASKWLIIVARTHLDSARQFEERLSYCIHLCLRWRVIHFHLSKRRQPRWTRAQYRWAPLQEYGPCWDSADKCVSTFWEPCTVCLIHLNTLQNNTLQHIIVHLIFFWWERWMQRSREQVGGFFLVFLCFSQSFWPFWVPRPIWTGDSTNMFWLGGRPVCKHRTLDLPDVCKGTSLHTH